MFVLRKFKNYSVIHYIHEFCPTYSIDVNNIHDRSHSTSTCRPLHGTSELRFTSVHEIDKVETSSRKLCSSGFSGLDLRDKDSAGIDKRGTREKPLYRFDRKEPEDVAELEELHSWDH